VITFRFRAAATILAVAALICGLAAVPTQADLSSRYNAHKQRADALRSAIQAETNKIQGYQGSLSSLEGRLSAIQRSVTIQERLLQQTRSAETAAHERLRLLQADYARDQRILAEQLVSQYEAPAPTLVGVIVSSRGFDDLLNRVRNMQSVERQNAAAIRVVKTRRREVSAQARQLAKEQARRQRATAAVLAERDQVAQLRLSIANRKLVVARRRAQNTSKLDSLRRTLAKEALKLDQQAAAAAVASSGGAAVGPGSCGGGGFAPHGGSYGFFPAAGTNYSVGEEPLLAARLDALGRSLSLHLIGISGYRTPQHSVEVGGFADDPHTRGIASDTPGVEGVPEATLNSFCLTRPFGGAREADHIQPI
jgi:peptidoglycan hydrolase CwlO-like protein